MGWVTHHCQMPPSGDRGTIPRGHEVGDLWRCTTDDCGKVCGKLWRITGGMIFWFWQEATPREVKRYKEFGWD